MIKVYLDNNIIVDIEDGKNLVDLLLNRGDCAYYFSQAHIEELLEAKDNPKVSQRGRLNLLSKLCGRSRCLNTILY